jgi:tRNA A37 methylthiotransferase MiaB
MAMWFCPQDVSNMALQAAGYDCVEDASDADVLIYNTCSIRDKAEQKVYSALGRQVRIHCCTAQSAGRRRP